VKWMARRPGAAPDKRGFGDLAALLAHVVFECEAWRRILSAMPGVNGLGGCKPPPRYEPMKTNTTASPVGGLTPAGTFHGGSFGVSGTPPVAYHMNAKPLVCDIDMS